MICLDLADLLHLAERALGAPPQVRDHGLLESALARPSVTVFGSDAYQSMPEKAAALTHSLAGNHALVDGNKRLALAGLIGFLGVNGLRLTWSNEEAYRVVMSIAEGDLDDIASIARLISLGTRAR